MGVRTIVGVAGLVFSLGAGTAQAEIVLEGTRQVTLEWDAATGAIGYYVIVTRDGGAARVEAISMDPKQKLKGRFGESLVVQVAGFDSEGTAGPISPPSEALRFARRGSGANPPPDEDPGSGDPGNGGGNEPPPTGSGVRFDHDGDGVSDWVVGLGGARTLWRRQAGGTIVEATLPPGPGALVARGDFDGDGIADLVWHDPAAGVVTLWPMGAGGASGARTFATDGLAAAERWLVAGSGDMDADGRDELVWFSRVAGQTVAWSLEGAEATAVTADGHFGAWSIVAIDDFTGTGTARLLWLDERFRELELDGGNLGGLDPAWRVAGSADLDGIPGAELVVRHRDTGAVEAWSLSAGSVSGGAVGMDPLEAADTLLAGGDYDGDGVEDLLRAGGGGDIGLWLSGASLLDPVEPFLAPGAAVLAGRGSDDSVFRRRFCSGDLDGSGAVDGSDYAVLQRCFSADSVTGECADVDMDGDGVLSLEDANLFIERFQGRRCGG
ncbi:MAG: dockerin type I domain-containing protein [Myxococcota bacterium]